MGSGHVMLHVFKHYVLSPGPQASKESKYFTTKLHLQPLNLSPEETI